MQGNKAYMVLNGVGAGIAGIDSQPMNANSNGILVTPDNTVVQPVSESANFSYGDSNQKIREAIAARIRADFGDPNMDVNFLD